MWLCPVASPEVTFISRFSQGSWLGFLFIPLHPGFLSSGLRVLVHGQNLASVLQWWLTVSVSHPSTDPQLLQDRRDKGFNRDLVTPHWFARNDLCLLPYPCISINNILFHLQLKQSWLESLIIWMFHI